MALTTSSQEIIELWDLKRDDVRIERKDPTSKTREGVTRLSDVTNPRMTLYKPDPEKDNGHVMIVCPGGGYQILAIDLEGEEIAEWLNSLGFTTYVLEYRVPQNREGAFQDVQRAIKIAKSRTESGGKVGILGFSAGGHLAASALTRSDEKSCDFKDEIDLINPSADFGVLIYPAYLDKGEGGSLSPEITLNENTPPMFVFMTADDPYVKSATVISSALIENKTPVEFHLYPEGGHGYGLREDRSAGPVWPPLCKVWLEGVVDEIK